MGSSSATASTTSLGSLALLFKVPSSPSLSSIQERKLVSQDMLASSHYQRQLYVSCMRRRRMVFVVHGKAKSNKFNGVDFDAAGGGWSEEEDEEEEGEDSFDWEMEMRSRVKEAEEMKELEIKAEELQYLVDSDSQGREEESEEDKRERVKKEIEKVAKEQAERRATAELMFELGQKAYGRGMYGRAVEFLEGALTIIPRPTLLGGEIQIWLAMAYDANNRHADCITLYKQLEKSHPSFSIRRQAADLRYIAQAPKLKISKEETVSIPLIGSSYDNYATYWSDKYKDSDRKITGTAPDQLPWSKDFINDLFAWRPDSGLGKNRTFWVAFTLWLGLVGAAAFLQK